MVTSGIVFSVLELGFWEHKNTKKKGNKQRWKIVAFIFNVMNKTLYFNFFNQLTREFIFLIIPNIRTAIFSFY